MNKTALYRFFAKDGKLLYVGITDDTHRRWVQHARSKTWWQDVVAKEVEWHENRGEAKRAEVRVIRGEFPEYNFMYSRTLGSPQRTNDPMEDVRRAQDGVREADERAKQVAKEIKDAARVELGHAINRARDAGKKQADIAEELGLTREQVRRMQVSARAAKKKET